MTYTIHISADNLTWDIIHKADEIGGMIEQVLDDTISWHDLKESEMSHAIDFIKRTWKESVMEIYRENYSGSFCNLKYVKTIYPDSYFMNKSLLDLLRREKKLLTEIKLQRETIKEVSRAECKTKYYEELRDKVISQREHAKEKAEENLLKVRKEIKEYISFIMEL